MTLSSDRILSVGVSFWAARVLQVAVELDLFTTLEQAPLTAQQICKNLSLHPRAIEDFLDALVATKFLERHEGLYRNGPEAAMYLVKGKPTYIGGVIELAGKRGYALWQNLPALLKTGEPQSEMKDGGDFYRELYQHPEHLKAFIKGMSGLSHEPIKALVEKFNWGQYRSFCDLGTAQGALPVAVMKAHPNLKASGFDLPPVAPIFEEYVAHNKLSDAIKFIPGNFLTEAVPQADVLVYGNILHGWNAEKKAWLVKHAYDGVNPGGALIIYETMIDDARQANVLGLLMSLNLRLETREGHDYTGQECKEWMAAAGFKNVTQQPLTASVSMICGYKA
jgi:precorrin-6B methylase 2